MRTLTHAMYQMQNIMPHAREKGCRCNFSRENFNDFIAGKWRHNSDCQAQLYENLPNTRLLTEAMRLV